VNLMIKTLSVQISKNSRFLDMIRNFEVDDVDNEDNDSKEYHLLNEADAAKDINVSHFEKLRTSAENFADKAKSTFRPATQLILLSRICNTIYTIFKVLCSMDQCNDKN